MITKLKQINISIFSYRVTFLSSIIDVVSYTVFLLRVKCVFHAPKTMSKMESWHIPQSGSASFKLLDFSYFWHAPCFPFLISIQLPPHTWSPFSACLWLFPTHKREGVWRLHSTVTVSSRHCTNTNRIPIWSLPRECAIFIQQTINNRA